MSARPPLVGAVAAALVAGLFALSLVATAVAAPPTWSGRWKLDIQESAGFHKTGVLTLKQRGTRVTGTFPWQFSAEHGFGSPPCFTPEGGTLTGRVRGRTLTATLVYPRGEGHSRATASLKATLSANGRVITGRGELLTGECGGGVYYTIRAVRIGAPR